MERSSVVPGIVLVVIGAVLLLQQFDVVYITWERAYPILLLLLGVSNLTLATKRKDSGNIFWGMVLVLFGIFFFLRNYEILPIYYYWDEFWPLFMIIPGLAFIMMFVFHPQEWGVLIPGGILLFLGSTFLSETLGFPWFSWYQIGRLWPVVLIVIGAIIVVSKLFSENETDD